MCRGHGGCALCHSAVELYVQMWCFYSSYMTLPSNDLHPMHRGIQDLTADFRLRPTKTHFSPSTEDLHSLPISSLYKNQAATRVTQPPVQMCEATTTAFDPLSHYKGYHHINSIGNRKCCVHITAQQLLLQEPPTLPALSPGPLAPQYHLKSEPYSGTSD